MRPSELQIDSQCQICSNASQQIQIILTNLRKQFIFRKNEFDDDNWNQIRSGRNKDHLETFCRLIQVIVGKKSLAKCNHAKLYNKYFRKIKYSHRLLAQFLEEKIVKIGLRNYQLYVINQQIDMISGRASKIFQKQYVSPLKEQTPNDIQQNPVLPVKIENEIFPNAINQNKMKMQEELNQQELQRPDMITPASPYSGLIYWPLYYGGSGAPGYLSTGNTHNPHQ